MDRELKMRGGILGGLVPLIILVGGLVWLSVAADAKCEKLAHFVR